MKIRREEHMAGGNGHVIIKEILDAEVRNTTECDADQMKEIVKNILGV